MANLDSAIGPATPIVSVKPIVLGAPERGDDLQVRVSAPVTGHALRVAVVAGAKYQWQLCTSKGCVAIKGATKSSLKLLRGYAGKSVRVRETLHGKTVFSKKLRVRAASK